MVFGLIALFLNQEVTEETEGSDLISVLSVPHHSLNPFDAQPPTFGKGQTTRREPLVFPEDFSQLAVGGEKGGFHTDAYIYRVGAQFKQTGRPFMKAAFRQTFIEETKEQKKGT